MNIDIRTVPQGHSEFDQKTMLESLRDKLPPFSQATVCRGSIDRTGSVLVVNLVTEMTFELECSRCLETFSHPLQAEVRLIIKEAAGKQGLAVDDDMVDFYYDPVNELVDISPALYDEFMIAVPLKPLCSNNCKGIEIKSEGILLGDAQSSTEENKQVDPRWEQLQKLKNQKTPE